MKRIGIIVQARMGSTRLPGKVMMDIQDRPMLEHIIQRLGSVRYPCEVIVATTTNAKDNEIEGLVKRLGIKVFRGSEEDVLNRYFGCAKNFSIEVIVRVTGDCPMIDPFLIGEMLREFLNAKEKIDYMSNTIKRTYPRGLDVEIFTFLALEAANRTAKKGYEREHVTPCLYEHPDEFRLANKAYGGDFSFLRLTVDTKEDLEAARQIYTELYKRDKVFALGEILELYRNKPDLFGINKEIKQKPFKIG